MRRTWFSLVPFLLGAGYAACSLPRPEGSYDGDPVDAAGIEADAAADTDEEIYPDASRPGRADAGGVDRASDAGAPIESPLIGDYWMRADLQTEVSSSLVGLNVRTTTKTAVYSLVAVRAAGADLTFRDWQCGVRMAQTCESGCRSITTALRDEATSAKAFLAPTRRLELDDQGGFQVTRGPYAVGWKGDFTAGPDLALPTDDDDSRVYNPDGGGDGIDMVTTIRAAVGLPLICNLRVVQRVDVTYEGTLEDGKFADGTLRDVGSAQNELANSCGASEHAASEAAPAKLRIVPAKDPIDVDLLPWTCPPLAELEAAFE